MAFLYLYYVTMAVLFRVSGALDARIIPPLDYNAYLGQPVRGVFTCILHDYEFIRWTINGVQITYAITSSTGIFINNTRMTDHTISQLVIPATSTNSAGVDAQCRAISIPTTTFVTSNETARFRVQGLLVVSTTITVANYNRSHNMITWKTPFTLDITDIEPDIFGYTVCYNVTGDFFECKNVTLTTTIIPKYFLDMTVSVTAHNIVGKSMEGMYTVIPCTSILPEELNVDTGVVFQDNVTRINFTFVQHTAGVSMNENTEAEVCLYLYYVTVDVRRNTTVLETTLFGYRDYIVVNVGLPLNTKYTARIQRVTSTHQLIFHPVSLSTFDVQDVTIVKHRYQDIIFVICKLALGTYARGFRVEVQSQNKTEVSINVSLSWECQRAFVSNNTTSCLQKTTFNLHQLNIFGNFTIAVYDWEKDGDINLVYFEKFMDKQYIIDSLFNDSNSTSIMSYTTVIVFPKMGNNSLIVSSAVGGGFAVVICFTILMIICVVILSRKTIRGKKANQQSRTTTGPVELVIQPNEAYTIVVPRMNRNEAYERVKTRPNNPVIEPPHMYDEIDQVVPNTVAIEPVYAEVANKVSGPHNSTILHSMANKNPVQDGQHYDNIA